MQNIYQTADIRDVEQKFSKAYPDISLMERAGLAVAEKARQMIGDGFRILIVCGPGNNGGDGLVAARHLHRWGYKVAVVLLADDPTLFPMDAEKAYEAFCQTGLSSTSDFPNEKFDLIIDAIFGIGLTRPVEGQYASAVNWINQQHTPLLAIDMPSGLNSDTGKALGVTIKATETITFIGLKPGLLTADAKDFAGTVSHNSIGINVDEFVNTQGMLLDLSTIKSYLPLRLENSHKGSNGNVAIIGGDQGMLGAVALAGKAALKMGAGRVYIGSLASLSTGYDYTQPELMWRDCKTLLKTIRPNVAVVGPGMGQNEIARSLLVQALESSTALILDADALNILASHLQLSLLLTRRTQPTVLTPHPAEAARLLGCNTEDIQNDRVKAAIALAKKFNSYIVLKGSGTVCTEPSGKWFINPTGNAGLATAGTGDVLSGAIGALIAQGIDTQKALLSGVFLHGASADELVQEGIGKIGLTATELIEKMQCLVNRQ